MTQVTENSTELKDNGQKLKFIDLFAGIGGLRLPLEKLGAKCVMSSEWDKNSQATYYLNYNELPKGDIVKIPNSAVPDHDLLLAGFPCQAFSVAGYRKGFEDIRGTMFFEIARILNAKRPKAFLLENVKGLKTHDRGRTFQVMMHTLVNDLGYYVEHAILNSMTHGNIPQNRERIFIVGFDPNQINVEHKFEFPKPIKLTKTIKDLLETSKQEDKYYYNSKNVFFNELKKQVKSKDTVYQWRRKYVRENKNNVCPTLTANMGTGGHNVPIILDDFGIRKLTPQECLRFQGYPKSFKLPNLADTKLYYQAGNSVTVTVVERIIKQMIQYISNNG